MALHKYLNPKNDIAFKKIFGTEKNLDVLMVFLNDIFVRTRNKIIEVELLSTIQIPELDIARYSVVDVMCKDQDGNRFIIEMQLAREAGFLKRTQYYAARAYIAQRKAGVKYKDLKEVICLAICEHPLLPHSNEDSNSYISYHQMMNIDRNEVQLKDFSYTFIELSKFNKSIHELSSLPDKWAYFFKHAEGLSEEDFAVLVKEYPEIERPFAALDSAYWTEDELSVYERIDTEIERLEDCLYTAKEEGREEGAFEALCNVARKLKQQGFDLEEIIAATGLARDVV